MQQIADWLEKLGMSEYAERFAENRIDLSVLPDLTDQHLEKLGVALGDRLKILRAIRELSVTTVAQPAASAAPVVQVGAERRQLTVMFCDLVGSTALSVRLDPEDLRSIIATYHRCCTELVERNGGFVAKYIGDGVLAYFGYPQAHEHDAERAVRAGLGLVEAMPKLATNTGSPLQVRIGIATGLVVVGDLIGAGAAQEQAVVGETPNLAARLQTLAEPGAVVIASTTHRLTGGLFEYRDLGTVALKGFAENIAAWQVLGSSTAESRFEALRTPATPLVGRQEEIELLLRRWEQAKRGDGCVVLISGEAGIGKSRIAQTFVEWISARPHTRLRYFCSPHHQDSALYPSIAQLERAAGFRRDDTSEQRLDKLEAVLAQGTNDLRETVPLLADLLSIPIGDRYPLLNLTPQKRKERTLHAQVAQVEGLSARQPVLMVWEDVHWSDPTTRESLDLLIDRVPALRVMVIITFRPEFAPPWLGRPQVTLLSLNRLPPRLRAEMIMGVTGGKALPRDIANQIIDRTDGVPLFIEELTKSVVESGLVTEVGDLYTMRGAALPLAIPTTLHASLLARLDRLAPTREVAQIGAALGRSFSHELISAVAGMPEQQLDDALQQLVRAELVFQRGAPPDAEYTFKHALVQDAAYGTLLRARRQELHGRIATALEERFPETVDQQPELLAHHCAQAGRIDKATGYWGRAGRQSLSRSAMVEAVAQVRKGLDFLARLPEDPDRWQQELDLQRVLGAALLASKGNAAPETGQAYVRARELSEQLDDTAALIPVLGALSTYHQTAGDYAAMRRTSEDLLRIGEQQEDTAGLLVGNRSMGLCLYHLGEFVAARASFERALDLYAPEAHDTLVTVTSFDVRTGALSYLSMICCIQGQPEQAASFSEQALTVSRNLRNPFNRVFSLNYAAVSKLLRRLEQAAEEPLDEQLSLALEHGFPVWLATANIMRGYVLADRGEMGAGLALARKGWADWTATGSRYHGTYYLGLLAQTCERAGQIDEAFDLVDTALKTAETMGEGWFEAELCRVQGEWLGVHRRAPQQQAEACFHRALTVAREQRARLWELRAATSLARLWNDQGKRTEARDLLAPIYGWFTEGFDTRDLMEAKALLGELVM